METVIDNLINGNLTDAKKGAKKYSLKNLYQYLLELGWTRAKASAAAQYLKHPSQEAYDFYCAA